MLLWVRKGPMRSAKPIEMAHASGQPDGSEQKNNLAFDLIPLPAARKFIPNLDAALTKCVWYGGV